MRFSGQKKNCSVLQLILPFCLGLVVVRVGAEVGTRESAFFFSTKEGQYKVPMVKIALKIKKILSIE
jgi:hypothetical protein